MNLLDPKTVALSKLNIIEASAGTGKTYTLAELYLRLIVEQDFKVTEILVVTYTNAATAELRERLRKRLAKARDDLLAESDHDVVHRHRLTSAIQNFDESAILTIHGFCQRVLGDFAFESGLHFDVELVGDDQQLLQGLMDDFWRKNISQADALLAAYLFGNNETPETLLQSIRPFFGKPYLTLLPVEEAKVEQIYQQAQSQFEVVKQAWLNDRDDIIKTVSDNNILSKAKYKPDNVQVALVILSNLMQKDKLPSILFKAPKAYESTENFKKSKGFLFFCKSKIVTAVKKNSVLMDIDFWDKCQVLWELYLALQSEQSRQYQSLRLQALQVIQAEMPARKQQEQVQSYDDLLLNLKQALSGEQGDWLAAKLRKQYPAALIDEFQDTDPVQYASFSRIYANSDCPVFLVGDPKQAIYSFRGADIFTYLSAKKAAKAGHTLGTNWRSHPNLVSAVNSLFSRQKRPFIYSEIPFHPVEAAREDTLTLSVDDVKKSLHFLWADQEKALSKKDMTAMSADATANEIVQLLNQSISGDATLFDDKAKTMSALVGGDIAVLVRNHKQANAVQQSLQSRGINSVQQGRDNVFESLEAVMLVRVLKAIAEPNSATAIMAALATELWPFDAAGLYALQQDEKAWSSQFELFYDCHQLWLRHGFMRAFRQLLQQISGQQQLLSQLGGERKLTNLMHLAELVQARSAQQDGSMVSILSWFANRIQSIDPNDETGQLRLESDEQLVNIITIHKSKGLEYPIVFCPFLWDSGQRTKQEKAIPFHDADKNNQAFVAFTEPELSRAEEAAKIEQAAEALRLLYVALTRARERCVICWGNVKGVSESALFSLLHPVAAEADIEQMFSDLALMAKANPQAVSFEVMTAGQLVRYQSKDSDTKSFSVAPFDGHIQTPWRVGSFSALTQGHDAELPDYDTQAKQDALTAQIQAHCVLDRFSFPRGAQAGTCLHAIFEFWDFTSKDEQAMQILVNKTLLQYGFESHWTPVVCEWVLSVCDTELRPGSNLKLNQLLLAHRIDELEFYFPVADLSVSALQKAVLPLLDSDSPLATVISRLQFSDLTGFMKGFIDLVFEFEGRFYIVDYKSNHLGQQHSAYQTQALNQAMISHDYPLQYLIYSLALHRYLKLRLPNYDPEQDLGGAYYLFIRGMQPEWGQAGVFFDKPSVAVLDALDLCLQGGVDG